MRNDTDDSPDASGLPLLNAPERRIIGSLLEKERTTPADFPLTLNSLQRACNQSTSRDPVVNYGAREIQSALDVLKDRGLVRFVYSQSNRATKFRCVIGEVLDLDEPDISLLGLLLLRGPQTMSELRTRSERWSDPTSGDVTAALARLSQRALVANMGRGPGQKEERWVHRLADGSDAMVTTEPDAVVSTGATSGSPGVASGPTSPAVESLERRVAALESLVDMLCRELGVAVEGADRADGVGRSDADAAPAVAPDL